MEILPVFILLALMVSAAALAAFFWSVRSGQFDDLDGASARLFSPCERQSND